MTRRTLRAQCQYVCEEPLIKLKLGFSFGFLQVQIFIRWELSAGVCVMHSSRYIFHSVLIPILYFLNLNLIERLCLKHQLIINQSWPQLACFVLQVLIYLNPCRLHVPTHSRCNSTTHSLGMGWDLFPLRLISSLPCSWVFCCLTVKKENRTAVSSKTELFLTLSLMQTWRGQRGATFTCRMTPCRKCRPNMFKALNLCWKSWWKEKWPESVFPLKPISHYLLGTKTNTLNIIL